MNASDEAVIDHFNVGRARITRIEEWRGPFLTPSLLFAGFDEAAYARTRSLIGPAYLDPVSDAIHARLQSWVVELDGRTILIDTGAGNDKVRPGIPLFGGLRTPFMDRLEAAGFRAGDIDVVVCTHLHVDHVGWNTRLVGETWQPTFPRAEYVFPAADAEYWDPREAHRFPPHVGEAVNAGFFEDSVRPILDAGLATLTGARHELMPGLMLEAAPGHTPGSQTVSVDGGGGSRALFCGDIVHHPLQIPNPGWNSIFCEDADLARRSRRAVLERAADSGALLIPAHFAGAHATYVERTADGFAPRLP
jgi:glyoxylase-like metal-dependent hydrolase (beta-lactamase superfamily II)